MSTCVGLTLTFFLPVRVLSRLFRRLFLEALQDAFQKDLLRFPGIIASLREPAAFLSTDLVSSTDGMVVYSKPPSEVRNASWNTWAATRTAWPSTTAGF